MSVVLEIPEVTDLDIAWGSGALKWMPAWEDIPEEFRNMNCNTEWNEITRQWFYSGLPRSTKFVPKDGVDPEKALRAIKATLGSFEPKHEHKEAAVAYMLSCWFEKVRNWKRRAGV